MPYWKGIFEISRVPPGEYRLTIEPHGSRPGQEGREFVDTMVDVTDHDLDLSLTVGPGASLTGHVVAEPSGAVTTPIGLRVTASKAHERFAAGLPIAAAVNGDWSFRMTGLSGSYEFFVSSDRPPPMLVATRVIIDGTSYPAAGGIALADGDHDVVVFVAPREAPKPTVDNTQTSSALVEQFKNEQGFGKQIDIAKAIVSKHDASDQGIPGAASDGRYRFERQIAADRYYAAHLLGDLRDPRGVALLVRLLDDPETQSIVPWSLGQIGDKRAIPPLIAALDADDPSKRVLVIYALEALHATEAVPRLLMLVNDDRRSRFGALVTVSEAAKAAIAKLQ